MINLNEIRKLPPLPFQGNKSAGRKKFLEFLCKIVDGDSMIFVDLFGGSFYLSYLVHKVFPQAKIICNDYDNYMERIKNIKKTNELLDEIKELTKDAEKNKRLDDKYKEQIDELLDKQEGYIDWLTLSASLLYSSRYATNKEDFIERVYWNRMVKKPYNEDIEEYIGGIDFVSKDWFELFEDYCGLENVIFLADPPFYKTSNFGFAGTNWTITDSLHTLEILKTPYFAYYTSTKSGMTEIINFMLEQGVPINEYETFIYKRRTLSKQTKENLEVILYRFDEYVDEEEEEEAYEEGEEEDTHETQNELEE